METNCGTDKGIIHNWSAEIYWYKSSQVLWYFEECLCYSNLLKNIGWRKKIQSQLNTFQSDGIYGIVGWNTLFKLQAIL